MEVKREYKDVFDLTVNFAQSSGPSGFVARVRKREELGPVTLNLIVGIRAMPRFESTKNTLSCSMGVRLSAV